MLLLFIYVFVVHKYFIVAAVYSVIFLFSFASLFIVVSNLYSSLLSDYQDFNFDQPAPGVSVAASPVAGNKKQKRVAKKNISF